MAASTSGRDIRAWLALLAALALVTGTLLALLGGVAPTEAYAPFGLIMAALIGQHLPSPE